MDIRSLLKISCSAILLIFLFSQSADAQGLGDLSKMKLPTGLSLSNQLEYSYDIDKKEEIFEDWLNLDYRNGVFTAGLRFETYQPNDPNSSISRGKNKFTEIDYVYIGTEIGNIREKLKILVGNFYALFARGMILKSYEDRNIRVDNNLRGVMIEGRYAHFVLTALTGMAANSENQRKDILHAVDLEYRGIKIIKYIGLNYLKIGGTFASNQPDREGAARTRLASVRVQPSIWNFDAYAEYGIKQNDDIKESAFNGNEALTGEAHYGNLNFYIGPFALVGEYKYYDNYSFTSDDGTVIYNTPPAVIKDYTYILLNRHPHSLDANNEKGFQVEATFNLSEETYFSANYGVTKSLKPSSYYLRTLSSKVSSRTQLKEFYIQANHSWGDRLKTIAAFGYNEELSSDTKSFTPIIENRFYLDEINTIRLIFEHQQVTNRTTDEQYFDDVITLEYLRSPKFSVSVVSEMQTTEPEAGRKIRKFWNFIQFAYQLGEHTDISLLVGSRQAGNICIGGVCRYEPEFKGVELKMQTRLY